MREWLSALLFACRRKGLTRVDKDTLTKLAGLLSLLGPVQDNTEALFTYSKLFLDPGRMPRWSTAVDAIVATAEGVRRIPTAVGAYSQVTGLPLPAHFNLTNTVTVMVKLSEPLVYISSCIQNGMGHFGAIFHPNTFRIAQRTLRGQFGQTADQEYARDAWSAVHAVEDA